MNIDEVQRPRQKLAEYNDADARSKCCLCCAAVNTAYVFGSVWLVSIPLALGIYGRKAVTASVWSFADHTLLWALPIGLTTFTHQALLSEALWSKNKKTVFECNVESSTINLGLWVVLIGAGTAVSRKFLAEKSKEYRMLLWDYKRKNRAAANKYLPSAFGTLSMDLDWYNMGWGIWIFHIGWGMVTMMLEQQQGAHYAMFWRSSQYSKRCSPRWREWREHRVREEVDQHHKVANGRWGNLLSSDVWRARGVR